MNLCETSRKLKAKQAIYAKTNHIKTFGVMSPENPNAIQATKEENEKYYSEFKELLKQEHVWYYKVKGKFQNFENSFMLFNVTFNDMCYWANAFGQAAFVFAIIENEGIKYQLWSRYKNSDRFVMDKEVSKTNIYSDRDPKKHDNYTKISDNFFYSIPFFESCANEYNLFLQKRIDENESYAKQFNYELEKILNENMTGMGRYLSRINLYGKDWKELAELHMNENDDDSIEYLINK